MSYRHATPPDNYQSVFGVDRVLADLVREIRRKPEERAELMRQVDTWLDRRLQLAKEQ